MSDDFFQYAESQMHGSHEISTMYTCWAVSGECETLPQAMNEATDALHGIVSRNDATHVQEAAARGDFIESHWISSDHQVTRLPGTETYPPTYVVSMTATVELRQSTPEIAEDQDPDTNY